MAKIMLETNDKDSNYIIVVLEPNDTVSCYNTASNNVIVKKASSYVAGTRIAWNDNVIVVKGDS